MKHKLNQVCYQNRYSQLDAESIMELASQSTDVKLLPSSKNYDLFTSFDEAGDLVCNGEVITLGKARYANIKYWCGDFISSNNNIIESKNTNFLRSKYLYYFLSYTSKDYYVEATTYPKFDQRSFDNHTIDIPSIDTQDSRLNILDSLTDLINKETLQLEQLDELTKSRFIEMFEGKYDQKSLINVCDELFAGGDIKKDKYSNTKSDEYPYPIYTNGEKDNGLYGYTSLVRVTREAVTISGRGTIGFTCLRKESFYPAVRLIVAVPNQGMISGCYLKHFIQSKDYGGQGASIPQLTVPMIKNEMIPVPPLPLQKEFESFVSQIDKLKFNVQQRIEKYKELLNKKMSEYFN